MASKLESFSKWLQLKIYRIEVSFSVYMFTPMERFIFYSVLFLLFSLTFIATFLYLPHHLAFIISRAWFYMHGDGGESSPASEILKATAGRVLSSVGGTAAAVAKTTGDAVRGALNA
ncbi:hypothetical protein N0V88_002383 [Collariella sp. IMI 366227]|nr:hypothetical protein N0V88_002383 [Collariella sp. IMI 366227]